MLDARHGGKKGLRAEKSSLTVAGEGGKFLRGGTHFGRKPREKNMRPG